MSNRSIAGLIALVVLAFLVTQTFYSVDPTRQVLVRQFGAIVGDPKTEPGLYAKVPLIQDIQRIDRRLLDYEATEFEIIAGDQKRLVVDAYARFRIVDAKRYAQTVPGGEPSLTGLLDSLINSEIRGVLSSVPLHAVLTDQRAVLMEDITRRVDAKTRDIGVEVLDVRLKRADLPQANSQSVFNRMKTDREREAGQLRAEGDEENQRIKATADRETAIIRADAGLIAQTTMGAADGEAAKIYADAFSRDRDFYAFYRRLEGYRKAFGAGGATMVLSPDSDFFRFFEGQNGAPPKRER
jgi:membrane protease subunit HflC